MRYGHCNGDERVSIQKGVSRVENMRPKGERVKTSDRVCASQKGVARVGNMNLARQN